MNFEKLTNQLQKSIGNAQSIALGQDHTLIEPCHVLLAMLDNVEGGTSAIFEKAGFKVSEIKLKLNQTCDPKVASRNLHDGTMITSELEDMATFLPKKKKLTRGD